MHEKIVKINLITVNIRAIVCFIISIIALTALFVVFWGKESIVIFPNPPFSASLFVLLGVLLHELIHWSLAAIFNKDGVKGVKLGILWKKLTPYCHCKNKLFIWQYIIVLLMPFLLLGLIPIIYGFTVGFYFAILYGALFSVAATADIFIAIKLMKEKMGNEVQDLEKDCGCIVYY